jgi:hypothetical protein
VFEVHDRSLCIKAGCRSAPIVLLGVPECEETYEKIRARASAQMEVENGNVVLFFL